MAAPLPAVWRFFTVPIDAVKGIPALEAVRGIAASLVFLVHFQAAFGRLLLPRGSSPMRVGAYLAQVGYHGVDVFFVLSGFLIYGSLMGRPTRLLRFFRRRVRRIYPTFLAVLAIYLLLGFVFPVRSKLPANGTALYVLQNALLLPGVFKVKPIITVAWSLSYEIFFYLGLGCIVAGLRFRSWPKSARIVFVLAWLLLWVLGGPYVQHVAKSFVLFLPGILVWEISGIERVDRWIRRVPSALVWGVFLFAVCAVPLLRRQPALAGVLTASLTPATLVFCVLAFGIGLFVLCASNLTSPVSRSLSGRPLRAIGIVSYSFYLIHGLVTNTVAMVFWGLVGQQQFASGPLIYAALMPVVYLACVAGAVALFQLVERPASL